MADFSNRILRAAKLDPSLYEEVESDKTALGQATMVVILSSIAAGVGAATAVVAAAGTIAWQAAPAPKSDSPAVTPPAAVIPSLVPGAPTRCPPPARSGCRASGSQ